MTSAIIKTTVRVARELWAKVREKATREGKPIQDVIEALLAEWVDKEKIDV